MFNKEIWKNFWLKFQFDIADTLQNNILNFSSLIALISLYIKTFHPTYSAVADNFMMSYLAVAPSAVKIKETEIGE